MSNQSRERKTDQEGSLGWVGFACWTALALMLFLQWVNGPSVSTDQAVVRTALVVIAVSGAVVLPIVNWRRRARGRGCRGFKSVRLLSVAADETRPRGN